MLAILLADSWQLWQLSVPGALLNLQIADGLWMVVGVKPWYR